MQSKLTLRLDDKLIQRAKAYAHQTGKSVSQMVADYFAALGKNFKSDKDNITPVVLSLKGSLHGANIDVKDYRHHLEKKHL